MSVGQNQGMGSTVSVRPLSLMGYVHADGYGLGFTITTTVN